MKISSALLQETFKILEDLAFLNGHCNTDLGIFEYTFYTNSILECKLSFHPYILPKT